MLEPNSKIYLREVPENLSRRQRFTLAHEPGHVLIPWQISQIVCSLGSETEDLPDYEPDANTFASRLLMPELSLKSLAQNSDSLPNFFDEVDKFELSPVSSVIALSQYLVPRFVFRLWNNEQAQEYSSDKNLPLPYVLLRREEQLKEFSLQSGRFVIAGRPVE